jgi:hypothetical protein
MLVAVALVEAVARAVVLAMALYRQVRELPVLLDLQADRV